MENRKIIVISIIVLSIISVFGAIYAINTYKKDKDEPKNISADAIKFKKEYENLNGKKSPSDKIYKTLSIMEDNPIKYIDDVEALEIITKKSGIIYMGFANCPWCRNAVPNLLNAASSTGIDTIYYLDLTDIRDVLTVNNKGKVTTKTKGSEAYMKMLTALNDHLGEYYVTDSNGKKINTLEKRIFAPTVIAVVNGEVVGININTVTTHISAGDGYIDMTKEENEELVNTYVNMMLKVLNSSCNEGC